MPRAPDPDRALSAVLKRLRDEHGETQESVAWHAGIAVATLQKIEHGQTSPHWDSVCRIIDALDVSLVELAKAVEAERKV
ncbi:MAG TPA: helix-turn-helix transcriptional regulator [Solirubrobacteraceae bacterium]|nr:helix-turn-helix transcriptional regulator [Solirubrobacteraceae bacterium]